MSKLISLQGATIVWNEEINSNFYGSYDVNFYTSSSSYTRLFFGYFDEKFALYYGLNSDLAYNRLVWYNDEYKQITATGGNDVTNETLINYVLANATVTGGIYEEDVPEYTLRIDGVEVTDYENVIINGVSYKCKQASIPTDLTGYTVTVPRGWTASAGYGEFFIEGVSSTEGYFSRMYIGYYFFEDEFSFEQSANIVCFYSSLEQYNSYESFTISITSGTDVTNQSLIQWLVDNNATFELVQEGGDSN